MIARTGALAAGALAAHPIKDVDTMETMKLVLQHPYAMGTIGGVKLANGLGKNVPTDLNVQKPEKGILIIGNVSKATQVIQRGQEINV